MMLAQIYLQTNHNTMGDVVDIISATLTFPDTLREAQVNFSSTSASD